MIEDRLVRYAVQIEINEQKREEIKHITKMQKNNMVLSEHNINADLIKIISYILDILPK